MDKLTFYSGFPSPSMVAATPIEISAADLPGAILAGSADTADTLQLVGGGIYDLTLAATFSSIETILGSSGHDTILLDESRFSGVQTFDGGDEPGTHWDEIVLRGTAFDLTGKTLVNIDRVSLQTDRAVLTIGGSDAAAKAKAMLASGIDSQNDTLEALGMTFTASELVTLHNQGIDTVIDAAGNHTDAAPVVAALDGDAIDAGAGERVFVDAGRDATVTDEGDSFSLLSATAPVGPSAPGRLGIDVTTGVMLSMGYTSGSTVIVGGQDIGMLWNASDSGLTLVLNANATKIRVETLLHALTYTMADVVPSASVAQQILVTLADQGGRRSVSAVTIHQDIVVIPPHLELSHASVAELAQDGTVVGLVTARADGEGDSFTYTLLDDAGHRFALEGDRLVVLHGALLDYEQQHAHTVTIRAKAADGTVIDQSFTIAVEDVVDETVTGSGLTAGGSTAASGADHSAHAGLTLIGGAGRDRLSGGEGRDMFFGKGGNDVLKGGESGDVFVFDTKPNATKNVDTILDFNPKVDAVYLNHKIFKSLSHKGTVAHPVALAASAFVKGTAALDAKHHVLYDARSGGLFYDPDGIGPAAPIKIAQLPHKLSGLNHKDFWVI